MRPVSDIRSSTRFGSTAGAPNPADSTGPQTSEKTEGGNRLRTAVDNAIDNNVPTETLRRGARDVVEITAAGGEAITDGATRLRESVVPDSNSVRRAWNHLVDGGREMVNRGSRLATKLFLAGSVASGVGGAGLEAVPPIVDSTGLSNDAKIVVKEGADWTQLGLVGMTLMGLSGAAGTATMARLTRGRKEDDEQPKGSGESKT